MVQENLMKFDAENKIWMSTMNLPPIHSNQSIGEAFVQSMQSHDGTKVLEYYFNTGAEKTAHEIYYESMTVAINLQRLNLKQNDVIVLYSQLNTKITALTMGCYLTGITVSFFETNLQEEHLDYLFDVVEPTIIFYEEVYKNDLTASFKRKPQAKLKYFVSIDATVAPNAESEFFTGVTKTQIKEFKPAKFEDTTKAIAALALSSGSSGIPKVVKINHASMLLGIGTYWCKSTSDAKNMGLLEADAVIFSFSPLRWVTQVQFMLQSVLYGVKRVIVNPMPDVSIHGREIFRKGKITHFFAIPSLFYNILLSVPESEKADLATLRFALLGGETTTQAIIDLAAKLTPNCHISRCYGMTEMAGCISYGTGLIIPGLQLKILDDFMQPVVANISGQLCIKSPVPISGYLKLDNAKYILEDGFFITGDYGFMDEQQRFHLQARYKDLVRANNITLIPPAIESLVSTIPSVAASALVGYKKTATTKDEAGVLFVVLKRNTVKSEDSMRTEIQNILKANLSIKECDVIKNIQFLEQMPQTTCGKVNRIALKASANQI